MNKVMRWKDAICDHVYLDYNESLRWKVDGYHGRYRQHDLVSLFESAGGYLRMQVPKARATIAAHHVVLILAGVVIDDDHEVDHLDGNKKNNSLSNLRLVSRRLNTCNRKKRSDNSSGITGISWSEYHQHFVIRRTVGGVRKSTSRKTLADALAVLAEITKTDQAYTDRHGK